MRIAVVGGGPGGLYFSALVKQLDRSHEVTVWERNAPDDTFGFGVVFSDETLGGIEHADPLAYADVFRPTFETRRCKYMWLGTDLVFEAFKFYVEETPHGVMQIHGYPYDRTGSTFIVEMHDDVWQRAFGDIAAMDLPPGESDTKSIELIEHLFAGVLDGHRVFANNSK